MTKKEKKNFVLCVQKLENLISDEMHKEPKQFTEEDIDVEAIMGEILAYAFMTTKLWIKLEELGITVALPEEDSAMQNRLEEEFVDILKGHVCPPKKAKMEEGS